MSLLSNGLMRSVVLCLGLLMLAGQAPAQNETLDPRVARELMKAYELFGEEQFQQSLQALNKIVSDFPNMKAFDRATVLQIRGSVHVNLENLEAGLQDFSTALELGVLKPETQNQLRFNVAQLYFVTEQYEASVREFERWMSTEGNEPTHTAYFMLAAAYYNLDEHRNSLKPIDSAIKLAPEPEKRYYDLKNVVLSELEMTEERTRLMETMISIWPDQLSYWRQLASLYMEQGEDRKSFSTLETAYLNGLIESEGDIVVLAQYYSSFNNPHRGAQMLEKELEAGNVERNVENLELLSQLWSQAREHRKAIPVLREAARMAEDGNLYFRLGQALMASEDYPRAEAAFENALDKGGLNDDREADAWLLLGTARFNQADPGEREQRMLADRAFARAEQSSNTRQQAREWRNYIRAINDTETRQAALEEEQREQMAQTTRERMITGCRARQLAGAELSDRCRELLEEVEREGNGRQ